MHDIVTNMGKHQKEIFFIWFYFVHFLSQKTLVIHNQVRWGGAESDNREILFY